MANDNETVKQVCECVEYLGGTEGGGLEIFGESINSISLAERILAAHEREMAAKDAMIAEQSKVNELQAEQVRDALNDVSAKDAEIASLRALVKELADAMDEGARIGRDHPMYAGCVEFPEWGRSVSVLVSKAREVVK